ncbi:hypothetical protein Pan153_18110 [Gimesia panareensis]|uniref:Uncharacterized protein n=1 Tax=Gimesia panareensis TaxID=2527978 RepID=A0A518FLD4_9PLAN|nr:hypothetical protein [Gimesia panareensis]QDV17176.1 hypothetical protein Pan153_18110 [Gimesia panareensis]
MNSQKCSWYLPETEGLCGSETWLSERKLADRDLATGFTTNQEKSHGM